jgi:dienelactone hydrolase
MLVVAVLLMPLLAPVRSTILTLALVPELMNMPARPLSSVVAEPTRITTTYGDPADRLDIYLPAGARDGDKLPAVVLELGVHPPPIDHPDVTRLASAISRLGVVVGVPDSSALRNLQLTPAEPAHLVDAVLAVSGRPEVDHERVGLAGFSAGASMALIAAADSRIADRLAFVSAFGGYADAEELLVDVATNTAVVDGAVLQWEADPGIRADITHLLTNSAGQSEADADAIAALMAAPDRPSAEAAVADFSPRLRDQLAQISPVNSADSIMAPVFLLHGEPDTAIPVGHAADLAAAIGDEVVRLTRFGRFGHGQPGATGLGLDDAGDTLALTLYLRDIVAAATE